MQCSNDKSCIKTDNTSRHSGNKTRHHHRNAINARFVFLTLTKKYSDLYKEIVYKRLSIFAPSHRKTSFYALFGAFSSL